MSLCFVTGVAGFIGSSVADRLLNNGYEVIGVDCFTDYYSLQQKQENLNSLLKFTSFRFKEGDLLSLNLKNLLKDVKYVFHFAGQPGVRNGFENNFNCYLSNNISATKILLDNCKNLSLSKFILASSSSIYGQRANYPVNEITVAEPISLYGSSKLMAENIAKIYFQNFGIPIIIFRLFTVYGPKQRPDMALNKFIASSLAGRVQSIFGNGLQRRDFTFIDDVVEACLLAAKSNHAGEIFNIGSGKNESLIDAIQTIEKIVGKKLNLRYIEKAYGDVECTLSDISKARKLLNYHPKWNLPEGLLLQYKWIIGRKNFIMHEA